MFLSSRTEDRFLAEYIVHSFYHDEVEYSTAFFILVLGMCTAGSQCLSKVRGSLPVLWSSSVLF